MSQKWFLGCLSEFLVQCLYVFTGHRLRHRNWRVRAGELDLVFEKEGTLVFVEVRARQHKALVNAAESFDARKRRIFLRTLQRYLNCYQLNKCPIVLQLVTVTWRGWKPQIESCPID